MNKNISMIAGLLLLFVVGPCTASVGQERETEALRSGIDI
jgi:hypothetical protein